MEGLREGHVRQDHEEAAASKSGTPGVASAEALGKEWRGSVAGTKNHCGWDTGDQEGMRGGQRQSLTVQRRALKN